MKRIQIHVRDMMPHLNVFAVGFFAVFFIIFAVFARAAAEQPADPENEITLVLAVMCESIENYEPKHTAAAFSISAGKISCFTSFDNIKTATAALHKWFRHDELVTTKRLSLKPPRWSTYSSIQLREADKGPWRVEIYNNKDKLLQTVRFSVID